MAEEKKDEKVETKDESEKEEFNEKSEKEDSDEEISEEESNIDDFSIKNLNDFINSSEEVKAPVLERIANAANPTQLERQIWNFSQKGNQDENEEKIRYGTQSGYETNAETPERSAQYSPEPNQRYSNIIRDKSMEETRRFVERNRPGSEWDSRNISDMEKPRGIENEGIRETQRYLSKGDYKT